MIIADKNTIRKPKFAVLLAAYNGSLYIREQIETILNQVDVSLKIFISIDLSSDDTDLVVKKISENNNNIKLLSTGNRYGSASSNFYRLIKEVDFSEFDYVAFADQDDVWLPGKLARAHAKIIETGSAAYSSDFVAFWNNGKTKYFKKSSAQKKYDFIFESPGPGCTIVLGTKLALDFKNLIITKESAVQNIAYHDWLVYAFARSSSKSYKWFIDNHSQILYRQHLSNQIGVNNGFAAYKSRLNKVLNGWWFNQSKIICDVIEFSESKIYSYGLCGGKLGVLYLALNARNCRRALREQLYFIALCIMFCLGRKT